ncbi:hypothetical protein [Pleomorphochaeta sp. DL1XJH-081]|uniref:hypothetical protein n=1 Tax=Pleomorphochaeta sp. DL1XJH-081 TaxID=3409690 RepID=UPI003BB4F2CD
MKIDAISFWQRVEEEWSKTGLSKTEFCAQTNGEINFGTWSNKKSLGKIPNLELASAFAEALGVSLDYLISGKETTDPLTTLLQSNPTIKHIAFRLTKCDTQQLHCVNSLLDTWRIDRMPGEGMSPGAILA